MKLANDLCKIIGLDSFRWINRFYTESTLSQKHKSLCNFTLNRKSVKSVKSNLRKKLWNVSLSKIKLKPSSKCIRFLLKAKLSKVIPLTQARWRERFPITTSPFPYFLQHRLWSSVQISYLWQSMSTVYQFLVYAFSKRKLQNDSWYIFPNKTST